MIITFTPPTSRLDAPCLAPPFLNEVYGPKNFRTETSEHKTLLMLSPFDAIEIDLVEQATEDYIINRIRVNTGLLLAGDEAFPLQTWSQFIQLISFMVKVLEPLSGGSPHGMIPFMPGYDPPGSFLYKLNECAACYPDHGLPPGVASLQGSPYVVEGVIPKLRPFATPTVEDLLDPDAPPISELDLFKDDACGPEQLAISFLEKFVPDISWIKKEVLHVYSTLPKTH